MNTQIFINELKGNFNLREPKGSKPTMIYFTGRIGGKNYKLSTGVKVYPYHWDNKKQCAFISYRISELDNHNNEIVNNKIKEINSCFNKYKEYICNQSSIEHLNIDLLKQYIYNTNKVSMRVKHKESVIHWYRKNLSSDMTIKRSSSKKGSTLDIYLGVLNDFEQFLKQSDRLSLSFEDINLTLIKEYETYLFNKVVNKKTGETTSTGTVGNKCVAIISILKRGEAHGKLDITIAKLDKYKKPTSRSKDNNNEIYLNETEINSIYNVPLVKDIDKQIRDVFVLQCYIGQRFSDMDKINTGTIKSLHNGKCIEIVQTKTSNKVMIPLLPIAEEILERYSYNIPVYNSDTVLRKIKKIGKLAGITELHTKTIDRGGKVIEVIEPRYNFIGTHTARRSFVSNMLKRGLDSKVLMQVTGHKTDSSFMRYIKLSSEDIANTLLGQSKTNNDYDLVSIIKQEIQNQLPNCPISELNALNDKLNTIIRGLHSLGADIDLSKLSMIARTTVTLSIENISINKIIDVLIAQRCFEKTSLSLTESNTRTLSGLKILEEYPYLNI